MTHDRLAAAAITRRNAIALMTGAAASASLGGVAFAQATPKRGGTLRVSAFTNPSSLDPTTGGAGSDHTFLYTMYNSLTEWDFETLKPKPGLAESWSFTDPTTLVINIRQGVTFHDGTQARCRGGQVQPRSRQDRSEVEHQGRCHDHRLGGCHGTDAGHGEAQHAGFGDAGDPLRSRRHDGIADGIEGRRRQRAQSHAGRHRRVHLRQLGRRRAHRHQAQREVLEAQPPLHGCDRVRAHSGTDDGRALGQRRAERSDLSTAAAPEGDHGALAQSEDRHRTDAVCLPDLLQLGQAAIR